MGGLVHNYGWDRHFIISRILTLTTQMVSGEALKDEMSAAKENRADRYRTRKVGC